MRILSLVWAATFCLAQDLPPADKILDRFIEASGGSATYEKITSETVTGVMEMKAQGIKGRMVGYKNQNDQTYSALEIDGVGKIEEGYFNGIAWEKSPLAGPRVKSGEEKAFYAREAKLTKDLRWRDTYSTAETKGDAQIDGVDCWIVELKPRDGGRPETRWYDKSTGLLKRTKITMATQMGDLPVQSTFASYQQFDGLTVPTRITTNMAGQEVSMTIQSVAYNKPVEAKLFVPPPDVRALADKQAAAPAKPALPATPAKPAPPAAPAAKP